MHVIGYQQGWATWLNAAGVSNVDPGGGLQCDTSLVAYELAAHGGGIALGRTSLMGKDLQSGRLVAPFDLAVPVDEAFYLIQPRHRPVPHDAEAFVDWLVTLTGSKDQSSSVDPRIGFKSH